MIFDGSELETLQVFFNKQLSVGYTIMIIWGTRI